MYLFSIFLLLYLSHDTLLGKVYFFHFLIVLKRLIGCPLVHPFIFISNLRISSHIFSPPPPPPPKKKKSLSVSFFPACSASHEAFLSFIFAVIFKLFFCPHVFHVLWAILLISMSPLIFNFSSHVGHPSCQLTSCF
jgi:hypothetical protein